jgi:hypothetical protein
LTLDEEVEGRLFFVIALLEKATAMAKQVLRLRRRMTTIEQAAAKATATTTKATATTTTTKATATATKATATATAGPPPAAKDDKEKVGPRWVAWR